MYCKKIKIIKKDLKALNCFSFFCTQIVADEAAVFLPEKGFYSLFELNIAMHKAFVIYTNYL